MLRDEEERKALAWADFLKQQLSATFEQHRISNAEEPHDDTSSATSELPEPQLVGERLPNSLSAYDQATLSCGLFTHYSALLGDPVDPYREDRRLSTQSPLYGSKPDFVKVLCWVIQQLNKYEMMRECDTLIITSDTRALEDIKHWKHTSRFLIERTRYTGPDIDKWFALFVPSGQFDAHFVWTAVYVLQALVSFKPMLTWCS